MSLPSISTDVIKGPLAIYGGLKVAKDMRVCGNLKTKYALTEYSTFLDEFIGPTLNTYWTTATAAGATLGFSGSEPSTYNFTCPATTDAACAMWVPIVNGLEITTKHTILDFKAKIDSNDPTKLDISIGVGEISGTYQDYALISLINNATSITNWTLKYTKAGSAITHVDTGIAPVANTYRYWRMEWINGDLLLYTKLTAADGWSYILTVPKASQTALAQSIYVRSSFPAGGVASVLSIDYIKCTFQRD